MPCILDSGTVPSDPTRSNSRLIQGTVPKYEKPKRFSYIETVPRAATPKGGFWYALKVSPLSHHSIQLACTEIVIIRNWIFPNTNKCLTMGDAKFCVSTSHLVANLRITSLVEVLKKRAGYHCGVLSFFNGWILPITRAKRHSAGS